MASDTSDEDKSILLKSTNVFINDAAEIPKIVLKKPLAPQVSRAVTGWAQRALQSTSSTAAAHPKPATKRECGAERVQQECPVCSYNEWDPLEEVIVGRAENAHVPPLTVEVKVRINVEKVHSHQ